MPRPIPLLAMPDWRLGWLLAALLWVMELRTPVAVRLPTADGTVLRAGSTQHSAPVAVLLEQITLNREAVAPSGQEASTSLPLGAALLPAPLNWNIGRPLACSVWLGLRGAVMPALFRQQQLLIALAPNAP